MTKFYKTSLLAVILLTAANANAQTTSTFEEKVLSPNSYYDGSDLAGGVNSGNAFFYNLYNSGWSYWEKGWAVSNIYDTVTQPSSYTQIYNAKEVIPSTGGANFGVGTQNSHVRATGIAAGKQINGFHITNSTYAYNSMKLGDSFAKKFGGVSGNDPDYFKLVIIPFVGGVPTTDSVEFYLADYRDSVNSNDYLVDSWTWVDLTSLGNVDSLNFILRSSDVGGFGINTPLYYCIDNFTTADSPSAIADNTNNVTISVYPNPFSDLINIQSNEVNSTAVLTDVNGKIVLSTKFNFNTTIDGSELSKGIYFLKVNGKSTKLVK